MAAKGVHRSWASKEEKAILAEQAATLRIIDGKTLEKVRRRLGLSHQSQVTRLVQYARENGFITVQRPQITSYTRDQELEAELAKAFGLRIAMVVDLTEQWVENTEKEDNFVRSDRIHDLLGHALSLDLGSTLSLNPPESIGLGGGRGTYSCARALNQTPRRLADTKLYALSGAMSTLPWDTQVADYQLLDARDVTQLMASALGVWDQQNIHRMNVPLAFRDEADKKTLLKYTALPDFKPKMALIGIGALTSGHRFVKHEVVPELEAISTILGELIECSDVLMAELKYCPVGELCNNLFYILPEKDLSKDLKKYETTLKKKILEINARTLKIDLEQLMDVDNLIAVAGGKDKYHAIYAVLSNKIWYRPDVPKNKPAKKTHFIDVLCTDSFTANKLLKT